MPFTVTCRKLKTTRSPTGGKVIISEVLYLTIIQESAFWGESSKEVKIVACEWMDDLPSADLVELLGGRFGPDSETIPRDDSVGQ